MYKEIVLKLNYKIINLNLIYKNKLQKQNKNIKYLFLIVFIIYI